MAIGGLTSDCRFDTSNRCNCIAKGDLLSMRRHYLFVAAAFLAGILTGAFAAAGLRTAPTPAQTSVSPDPGSSQNDSTEPVTEPLGAPTAAVLSAVPEEVLSTPSDAADPFFEPAHELRAMIAAWTGVQNDLARLRARVDDLERRLSAAATNSVSNEARVRTRRPETPEQRRSALVKAGVAEDRAADLVWRQGQLELDRLDLRDLAIREGWFGSDRYRDELDRIAEDTFDLRAEIGEGFYDRYLFEAGKDNRVEIASIIPGSAAEEVGLEPGDLVESYGEARVFTFRDLRTATSEGERGELVPVRIRRDGGFVDAWVPRGPLGVRLDRARARPMP